MEHTLELAQKKYEKALETIAYLKHALYYFQNFDPKNPKECGNKVFDLAFMGEDGDEIVVFDKNNFTPGRIFLKNWCKDTQKTFGTSISDREMHNFEFSKEKINKKDE